MSFKVGDVVQLKSGGPLMTVYDIDLGKYVRITCQWFGSSGQLFSDDFLPECLTIINVRTNGSVSVGDTVCFFDRPTPPSSFTAGSLTKDHGMLSAERVKEMKDAVEQHHHLVNPVFVATKDK